MTTRRVRLCISIHAVPTAGLLLQGLLYLTTQTFMPYHADALAVPWEQLPLHHQGFVLGVIRAMGAGSFAVALALLLILWIPFRRGDRWAFWAVPLIGIVFTALTAYAAYTIDTRTPASTPWRQTLGLTAVYALGALLACWPGRSVSDHPLHPRGQPVRTDAWLWKIVGWIAILAPLIHTLTDVSEWVCGGYSAVGLWLNYAAFVPLPALFLGLYSLQHPRIHVLGLIGAVAYGFAFVYFAHTTLVALATQTQDYQQLWDQMGSLYTMHGVLMIAGGLAFGVATVRAGVLPRWTAWLFLCGVGLNLLVALLPVSELLQTVGSGIRNAGIVGMGWSILRSDRLRRNRPMPNAPPPQFLLV